MLFFDDLIQCWRQACIEVAENVVITEQELCDVPFIEIRLFLLEALQDFGFLHCIHADQDDPVRPPEDIEIFKALDRIGLRACKKE